MWELRGPFGEHRGYVTPDYEGQAHGMGVILWIALIGMAVYKTAVFGEQVMRHPGDYAYVYVFAAYFYAYTLVFPAVFVVSVMHFFGSLTPWVNLNVVLAWLSAPAYLLAALVLIAAIFQALGMALKTSALGLYMVPALIAGIWAGGAWLFA